MGEGYKELLDRNCRLKGLSSQLEFCCWVLLHAKGLAEMFLFLCRVLFLPGLSSMEYTVKTSFFALLSQKQAHSSTENFGEFLFLAT